MLIDRILTIINHLSIGPETIDSLYLKLNEEGFAVSRRTIYRDIEKISQVLSEGKIKMVRLDGEFNKAKWMIVNDSVKEKFREELIFQTFLTQSLKPSWQKKLTGNALKDLLSNGSYISKTEAKNLMLELSQFCIDHSDWGEFNYSHEHYLKLKDILWAIANQRILHIIFYDHKKDVQLPFRPLKVVYHRGSLNVIGWLFRENEDPQLNAQELDLIKKVKKTNERFHKKGEERQLANLLSNRFGIHDSIDSKVYNVKIQMGSGPALFLMNRAWQKHQTFRKKEKHYIMEFKSAINIELIGWIFSWLEHFKVLSPSILKEAIQKRSEYMAKLYREDLPPVSPSNTDDPWIVGK